MSIVIRDVREHELDSVLALNNAAGSTILPLDLPRLRRFYQDAEYFRVAERNGALAGFLVAFGSDSQHDSENFCWFRERNEDFLYIDRVVVASSSRGAGLGRTFYADVQTYAEVRYPQLACEVFLEDGNGAVLLFHGSFGFREMGQRVMHDGDGPRAAMLMKPLCSHAWIRQTYGDNLPRQPWLIAPHNLRAPQRPTGTG